MFKYNHRIGQMEKVQTEHLTADEIFDRVKRGRRDLIRAYDITDDELKTLIRKILGGTRNTMYLAPGKDYQRLRDIAAYIVREHSY